jgi:hypothetical protein
MKKAFALLGLLVAVAGPAAAWTPRNVMVIGEQVARLAPPDLYRQLARNKEAYRMGLQRPFQYDPSLRFQDENGQGQLHAALVQSIDDAVRAIREHKRFNEVAYRIGAVVHLQALVDWPLAVAAGDPDEARYAADFGRYAENAQPRVAVLFYGFRSQLPLDRGGVLRLVADAIGRSRGFYPSIGREYRRVGFTSGVHAFDDKSTAYAVASLSLNHALSDSAEAVRYIWQASGGVDSRRRLPLRGQGLTRLDAIMVAP